MIYDLDNRDAFSNLCLQAWHKNSNLWLQSRVINPNIRTLILSELLACNDKPRVADIGCGDGWLLNELKQSDRQFDYSGIDHNDVFIDYLKTKHPEIDWHCIDFEHPVTRSLWNRFNFVVSCLSIIEMAQLDIPFANFHRLLNPGGKVILITLNPFFELIRLNHSYPDLISDIQRFRHHDAARYYQKDIVINGQSTGHQYYGVLHSMSQLFRAILGSGFSVVAFHELNFDGGSVSEPIFHAYILEKNAE